MKKKKYMFMKVYLYEWYVSRITYINSDIVEESIYEISVYTYVIWTFYSLPYDVFVLCIHHVYVYVNDMCLFCKLYLIATDLWKV